MRAMVWDNWKTAWGDEIGELTEGGWDRERATDYVLLKYLHGGDLRFLFDLLRSGERPQGTVLKYLAGMIDCGARAQLPDWPFPFEIHVEPRTAGPHDDETRTIQRILKDVARNLMAKGLQPSEHFWMAFESWLCAGLDQQDRAKGDPVQAALCYQQRVPFRAVAFRLEGMNKKNKGRNPKIEQDRIDKLIVSYVDEFIAQGVNRKVVFAKTYEKLAEIAKEDDGFFGKLRSERSLKRFYYRGKARI
jgi:hypothetical protein